jgi:hypothetical protein
MSNSLAQYYGIIVSPPVVVQFYQIGYTITFLLGFLGNTASLLTFSRPTLRKISTGCLFIILAISDMTYLIMCFIDYLEFGLHVIIFKFEKVNYLLFIYRLFSIGMLIMIHFVDFVHLSRM